MSLEQTGLNLLILEFRNNLEQYLTDKTPDDNIFLVDRTSNNPAIGLGFVGVVCASNYSLRAAIIEGFYKTALENAQVDSV